LLAHESLCARGQARLEAELAELGADAEAVAAQSADRMQERDALAAALAAAQAAAPGAPAQDCARALAVPAADAAAAATVERAAIARALAGAGASPEADADDAAGPGAASLDEVLARATALVRRSEAAEAAAAAAAELRGALAAAEQRAAALQDESAAAQVRGRRRGWGRRRFRLHRYARTLGRSDYGCARSSGGASHDQARRLLEAPRHWVQESTACMAAAGLHMPRPASQGEPCPAPRRGRTPARPRRLSRRRRVGMIWRRAWRR